MQLLPIQHLNHLTLAKPDELGRNHLSSASGMVTVGDNTWVVSDELSTITKFADLSKPGEPVQLLPVRKKKYDLESITRLTETASGGALLLALGSGSHKKNVRDTGVLFEVDARGELVGAADKIDLAPLYDALRKRLPVEVNIEGAAIRDTKQGAELVLAHRGSLPGDQPALITLDAKRVIASLTKQSKLDTTAIKDVRITPLGALNGVQLGFSELLTLPDGRIAFSASAESKDPADADDQLKGSTIGFLDHDLNVAQNQTVAGPIRKIEGLELAKRSGLSSSETSLIAVTDADDPESASELLRTQ